MDPTPEPVSTPRTEVEDLKDEQYFYEHASGWLFVALFSEDKLEAAAATSNIMKALRNELGRDAMLIAIADTPAMTRIFLPEVWSMRERLIRRRSRADPQR